MGQRLLLLMGRNCCAETKESGLLPQSLVPTSRCRGLRRCGKVCVGMESRRQRTIYSVTAATQPTLAYACMLLFSMLYFTTGSLFQQVPVSRSSPMSSQSVPPKLFPCISFEASDELVSHGLWPLCFLPQDSYPASKGI